MEDTYTYTARSLEHPQQVVTFTLHDKWLSVDIGAPVEQVENIVSAVQDDAELEEVSTGLKPLALSLMERGTKPCRLADVSVGLDEDRLFVGSWTRVSGLRLSTLTLMHERVDNPDAAQAFVDEVQRRQESLSASMGVLGIFDYWATWVAVSTSLLVFFLFWRKRSQERGASE